jgi:DcmR-like sensory protein
MNARLAAPRLAGALLDHHVHACAFFHSRDEEYETFRSFIGDGLEQGEKALHITAPDLRDDHLARLRAAGLPVDAALRAGQLEVLGWDQAYLRDARFDPFAMVDRVENLISTAQGAGYPRTRLIGHMEWALEDHPGVEHLLEYEARVNEVVERRRQPAVCVYDLKRFSGATVVDVLRTHPLVLIGGVLHENPFFVEPDKFLQQLREGPSSGPWTAR